ncbi:N-acetylneuraminate synthase family protein [Xanthomonas campestris]|uniref:N-acetylneuraminate synthase family protein n=1 Tax=Xanthomonas campestris TaxID=339 RepID=UPI001E47A7A5|nr:N-acetylneuraminate synthase family protein [Xanthomonas campestris]MCC5067303.1 N-acetylneuraminate synthase family protein [Xanthomonas campestris]
MRITRDLAKLVVFSEDSLIAALNKMSGNTQRLIFAVSESGVLEGVLTDGDLRRWLTQTAQIDLNAPVSLVMNRRFVAAADTDAPDTIRALLSHKVLAVPLLDRNQRIKAVALSGKVRLELEGRLVDEDAPTFVIAEIGNNHQGDLATALRLIDAAADAGADCAKFQMRDLQTLYRNAGDSNDASADLGSQYTLDLLSRFQLTDSDLFRAFDHCRARGMVPLCTPWDHTSLSKLEHYGLPGYKVASADFTNHELIEAIAASGKPMICSTGMCTEAEILDGVRHLHSVGANFVLLHCNSTYPAPFKDVNLHYLRHLKEISGGLVGYSGHERDIHVAVAAVALGAKVIEKHFTLDREQEGNDHKVSLLPSEFSRMVEGIRQVEQALGTHNPRQVSQGELMNRETLAKSLVAACDIPAGIVVTAEMVQIRSPGQGLQPNRKHELLGRSLSTAKKSGECFFPSDLGEGTTSTREYSFALPWGVPVRYHDLHAIRAQSNMDLLEIHLSYKDLELDFRPLLTAPMDLGLVVHAPELFAGDHTLDLCSPDDAYRQRSVREMQRVIELARQLTPYFKRTARPLIVTNVGGFSRSGHCPADALSTLYAQLELSLAQLDTSGVEILPQTMPPFPWHFGGQQFHNIFVDADSTTAFCKKHEMRICLDVSHSKLACNHRGESFAAFVRTVAPYVAHMHLADARGVDGEGLQIGDGEVDWREFLTIARSLPHKPSFIPEVWQGHKNGSEGAWKALNRLQAMM